MRIQSQVNPPTTYTVEYGDTLFTIAQKFYGDGTQWRTIFDANQAVIAKRTIFEAKQTVIANDPTELPVGTALVIPSGPRGSASRNPPSWTNPTFRQ